MKGCEILLRVLLTEEKVEQRNGDLPQEVADGGSLLVPLVSDFYLQQVCAHPTTKHEHLERETRNSM